MTAIADAVLGLAHSPWVYLCTALVIVVDGFFPPVPSEVLLTALAALATATGGPELWLLICVAAVAAAIGDTVSYLLGRCTVLRRTPKSTASPIAATLSRTRGRLEQRPAITLLTARFIPVGRVAFTMTTGALGFPLRRFFPLSLAAGTAWACSTIGIGVIAGTWTHRSPLLGVAIGITIGLATGLAIDFARHRIALRGTRRAVTAQSRMPTHAGLSG